MKITKRRVRNLFVNDQLFTLAIISGHPEAYEEILDWHKRFNPDSKGFISILSLSSPQIVQQGNESYLKKVDKIREMEANNDKMYLEVLKWMVGYFKRFEKYGIGNHWAKSIIEMIITGFYCPPDTNYISYIDTKKNKVIIEIDQNVSLNDVKNTWGSNIAELQSKLKEVKKPRIKKHYWENYSLLYDSNKLKKDNIKVDYDSTVGKRLTDLDKVGLLFKNAEDMSEKADKKRAGKLRTARHRAKNYTKLG